MGRLDNIIARNRRPNRLQERLIVSMVLGAVVLLIIALTVFTDFGLPPEMRDAPARPDRRGRPGGAGRARHRGRPGRGSRQAGQRHPPAHAARPAGAAVADRYAAFERSAPRIQPSSSPGVNGFCSTGPRSWLRPPGTPRLG